MSIVVPAILPKTREELDTALAKLAPLQEVTDVQIDVVDGRFATPASWPYAKSEAWELPMADRFRYDLDLMVEHPEESLGRWIELGASRITVHAESVGNLSTFISRFKERFGHETGFTPGLLSLGLAVSVLTPLTTIEPFLEDVDYVELMGITIIGRQGQPFDPRVIPRIRELRAKYPKLTIQIDGAVTLKTAPQLLEAGASRLIAGSAVLKAPDMAQAIKEFESLGVTHGVYER